MSVIFFRRQSSRFALNGGLFSTKGGKCLAIGKAGGDAMGNWQGWWGCDGQLAIGKDKLQRGEHHEKRPPMAACSKALAEMEGFEPPVPSRVHRISSAARSTTLAHLLFCGNKDTEKIILRRPKK
jgi:hypothetical protein